MPSIPPTATRCNSITKYVKTLQCGFYYRDQNLRYKWPLSSTIKCSNYRLNLRRGGGATFAFNLGAIITLKHCVFSNEFRSAMTMNRPIFLGGNTKFGAYEISASN